MHPNAEAAIRAKFSKLVDSLRSGSSSNWLLDWDLLSSLSTQLAKEKPAYLNMSDAIGLIYDVVYSAIPESPNTDRQPPLSDQKKQNLIENFIATLHHIPTNIEFSFPLPRIPAQTLHNLAVGEGERFELRQINDENDSNLLHFITVVPGYWSNDFDSPTPREAMSRFKAAMQFLQSDDIVYSTRYCWSELKIMEPPGILHAGISFQTPFEQKTATIEIPRPISDFLSYLFLAPRLLNLNPTGEAINLRGEVESVIAKLSCLLKSEHPHSRRIRAAAEWQIDALSNHNETMALVQTCIGLESIYGDDSSNGGLTDTLSDRCAYSLASSFEDRARIKSEFKEIYRLRSKIVHGVTNNLKSEDRVHARNAYRLLRDSIKKESGML